MPFTPDMLSGCIDDVTDRIVKLEQRIEIVEIEVAVKEVMKLNENLENMIAIGIHKGKVVKNNSRPHEIRLEFFKSMLKTLKIEKQIYKSLDNNKNKEIFSKLFAKYAEEQGHGLETSAKLVELNDMSEGDYLDYAKNLKRQYECIKAICDFGKM